ncbi:MAG: DUF1836 domain-containing protein [Lachnospiraceae bacterium]|nr:DUF1836 domain-containing protein [Lachnospiraceae bacterium]
MSKNNVEYVRQIIENLKKLDYIRPGDIPNIDLYMDQVTTFMDEHLADEKRFPDDKILTKTMINNYTKNNLLPPPKKKKYSKEHMLLLIFIYYFKNILSINDIRSIFNPLNEIFSEENKKKNIGIDLEAVYEEVFSYEQEQVDALVRDVVRKFKKAEKAFDKIKEEEDREFLVCFTFICILSFDVYIKKVIIEKMIDQYISPRFGKKNEGEKKTDK